MRIKIVKELNSTWTRPVCPRCSGVGQLFFLHKTVSKHRILGAYPVCYARLSNILFIDKSMYGSIPDSIEKRLHPEDDVAVCDACGWTGKVPLLFRTEASCVSNVSKDSLLELLGDLHNKYREESNFGWSLCLPQLKVFRQDKREDSNCAVATVSFSILLDTGEQNIDKAIQSIKDYLSTKGWNEVLPIDGNLYPRSFNFSLTIMKKG